MGAPIGAVIGGVVGIGVCVIAAVVGIFIQNYTTTPICECVPPLTCANATEADPICECLSKLACTNATEACQERCKALSQTACANATEARCKALSQLACANATEARCKAIELYMKVPLIATHLIPFVLMPVSMWVVQDGAAVLQEKGMKSPMKAVLGLGYIMVSISGEVGWHVHQRWFYHEDYDIMNFFFYAFITLGTTFWALGAQSKDTEFGVLDALLMLCTPLTALTYGWATYATFNGLSFMASKVPIYIIMAYQYGVLSWRLFNLLNNSAVWLFPFFSVGVNLFFVGLLNIFQTDVTLNPLFHMLHDAAGTELGVLVITIIIRCATTSSTSVDSKKKA